MTADTLISWYALSVLYVLLIAASAYPMLLYCRYIAWLTKQNRAEQSRPARYPSSYSSDRVIDDARHKYPSGCVINAACTLYRADYPTLGQGERQRIAANGLRWLSAWCIALDYYPSPLGLRASFVPNLHSINDACSARSAIWYTRSDIRHTADAVEATAAKAEAVKWFYAWQKVSSNGVAASQRSTK